ncbi:MAG: cell division protein FtsA [Bacteroidales bacterium]|nr:cell division protein FtsA [Bacteroidales bacterium]MBN2750112.1 cell division protein FtsA [Bacteroidales bacterium]
MAHKSEYVAAIDLGTTKIVTIVGRKNNNGKLQVVAYSKAPSVGIKRGVVLNIEETVNAIQRTVEEVQMKSGVVFGDVFVGIAGQHIRSIRNRGYINRDAYDSEITNEDVQRLIDDMHKIPIEVGEEILHVLPQNFIVDNEAGVRNPIGMSGRRLEANFHIVIGQTASAKNIEKCVNRVGLKVNDLILEPLASADAVLTDDEKEAGVVLVDIGGGTTDVVVYYDGIVRHTAVIPFGGNVITNDIKEGCSILLRQAESLKVQFGSALGDLAPEDKIVTIPGISGREPKEISFKSLAYIIQSRMEEIINYVHFEIENSGYAEKLSAGIVLTGGGSLLLHLPQLVKFKTGYDVRLGLPNEYISADSPDEVNQPSLSTAIGLILKGFETIERFGANNGEEEEDALPVEAESAQKPSAGAKKPPFNTGKKSSFIDNVKKKLTEIFEENDSEM